jgi:alpha-tubulin suppressor-like RCC1 family protein
VNALGLAEAEHLKCPRLFASNDEFLSVSCGKDHMAMVTLDGRLMTMGSNDHSKLGLTPVEKEKHNSNSWKSAIGIESHERIHT